MANLIPPSARSVVIREYWMRVAAVWLFLISAAGLVIIALMVPTYMLVASQQGAFANRADEARTEQEAYREARDTIRDANALLVHLNRSNEEESFVALVSMIDTIAGSDVRVRSVSLTSAAEMGTSVTLDGTAADRTALAAFRDRLESDTRVAAVNLPIGSLAGDRDISFMMEVTLTDE